MKSMSNSPAGLEVPAPEPASHSLKPFIRFWAGELFSSLGSATTAFALGFWLFGQTGAIFSYSIIFFFRLAPRILLSPFAGVIADFLPRQRSLILCSGVGVMASAGLLLAVSLGHLSMSVIYVYLAGTACIDAVKSIIYSASVSDLVQRENFVRAAGFNTFYRLADNFVAPAVAMLLMPLVQIQGVIVVDILSFCLAIGMTLTTPFKLLEAKKLTLALALEGMLSGFRLIGQQQVFLLLAIAFALVSMCTGSVMGVLLPLLTALGAGSHIGSVNLFSGVVTFLGALYIIRFGIRSAGMGTIIACFGFLTMTFLLISLWLSLPAVYLLCLAIGLVMPVTGAVNDAVWRTAFPSGEMGRVIAARTVIAQLPLPLMYLGVGPLVDKVLFAMAQSASAQSLVAIPASQGRFVWLFLFEVLLMLVMVMFPALYLRKKMSGSK